MTMTRSTRFGLLRGLLLGLGLGTAALATGCATDNADSASSAAAETVTADALEARLDTLLSPAMQALIPFDEEPITTLGSGDSLIRVYPAPLDTSSVRRAAQPDFETPRSEFLLVGPQSIGLVNVERGAAVLRAPKNVSMASLLPTPSTFASLASNSVRPLGVDPKGLASMLEAIEQLAERLRAATPGAADDLALVEESRAAAQWGLKMLARDSVVRKVAGGMRGSPLPLPLRSGQLSTAQAMRRLDTGTIATSGQAIRALSDRLGTKVYFSGWQPDRFATAWLQKTDAARRLGGTFTQLKKGTPSRGDASDLADVKAQMKVVEVAVVPVTGGRANLTTKPMMRESTDHVMVVHTEMDAVATLGMEADEMVVGLDLQHESLQKQMNDAASFGLARAAEGLRTRITFVLDEQIPAAEKVWAEVLADWQQVHNANTSRVTVEFITP
jgi:hypothetical protein